MAKSATRTTTAAVLFLVAVSAALFFGWTKNSDRISRPPEQIEDYLFWEPKKLSAFKLTGSGDLILDRSQMKGKWSFIFFGYTHCPDVCPATLASLGMTFKVLEKSDDVSSRIQGFFVSVDPARDDPTLLKNYVGHFHPDFTGVTGDAEQVTAFSRQMGALYTIDREDGTDDYDVTHNSSIFVVDPRARLYARFPPPHEPAKMADIFVAIDAFWQEEEKRRGFF